MKDIILQSILKKVLSQSETSREDERFPDYKFFNRGKNRPKVETEEIRTKAWLDECKEKNSLIVSFRSRGNGDGDLSFADGAQEFMMKIVSDYMSEVMQLDGKIYWTADKDARNYECLAYEVEEFARDFGDDEDDDDYDKERSDEKIRLESHGEHLYPCRAYNLSIGGYLLDSCHMVDDSIDDVIETILDRDYPMQYDNELSQKEILGIALWTYRAYGIGIEDDESCVFGETEREEREDFYYDVWSAIRLIMNIATLFKEFTRTEKVLGYTT